MHRLPQMNHGSITVQNAYARGTSNGMRHRKYHELRNGKSRPLNSHRNANDRQFISDLDDDQPSRQRPLSPPPLVPSGQATRTISISMPPPASVPVPYSRTRHTAPEFIPVPLLSTGHSFLPETRPDIPAAKSNLGASTRNVGFKPIGKASSLKKFFPSDEEEMDITDIPSTMNRMNRSDAESLPSPQDPRHVGYAEFHDPTINLRGYPPNESLYRASYNQPALRSAEIAHLPARHLDNDKVLIPPLLPSESLRSLDEPEQLSPHQEVRDVSSPSRSRTPPRNDHEAFGGGTCTPSNKDLYKIISQVGEGTFGQVYKARNTITGTHAALKRIRMESERDGFPVTAMREIKLLQSLRHENVVRLYEMMVSKGSVYMVFEYMDHDLTGVLSQNQFTFSDAHLKSLCHQMLAGLAYLHHKGVIHRDIKGSNILINNRGELKLADFGLARFYQKRRRADYTNRVITLWYRPPELLFGATVYGPEVDMWSAGCIMLELFTKKPVFQGGDEIHQLEVVFKIMGTPTPERWADLINLPWFELVKPQHPMPNRFREAFQKWMSPAALDLAEKLLAYDPSQRITALQAMDAPYFVTEFPSATPPIGLVDLQGEWHELETKRERAKRKERKNAS